MHLKKPIGELLDKIESLKLVPSVDISAEISRLEKKVDKVTADIYSKLDPWKISQVARHPARPYTLDYIPKIFSHFVELHGDRTFADDHAIVGGIARLHGKAVMLIGHQKGRDTKARQFRNFGMPRPEGYRKALRLMKLAEKFHLPIITFVDTPGAFPCVDAEERNQSEAIGRNLLAMARIKTPILTVVIGEGGSGGALAVAVSDVVMMMQYSIYSVISPEGCASILWKSADKAPEAAGSMALTAERLQALKLIDRIIEEPLGGAHRDVDQAATNIRQALDDALRKTQSIAIEDLVVKRQQKYLGMGVTQESQKKK